MKRFLYTTLLLLVCYTASYAGAPTKVISGNITGTVNWVADTIYILTGKVYLKNGATLNIAPGTIIKGDTLTAGSALIVTRGSKIYAIGTPTRPIVFTSNAPKGKRRPAHWGGICIAGNAKVNVSGGEAPFEGGNLTNPDGSTTDDKYGGLNDADNSGVLKYVRIEYAGYPYQQNNELNSLTMGGVGNGTEIDYVQCSYGFDDAFEFFGGTVNAKHLVSFKGNDDDFDTDFGFRGNVQFGVVYRDTLLADPVSGANAFESDNDASGSGASPYTAPVFSNMTIIGPKRTSTTNISPNHRRGAHIRRNSRMSLFNSVIGGYPVGIKIDGDSAHANADNGLLEIKNTELVDCTTLFDSTAGVPWNITPWFTSSANSNTLGGTLAGLQLSNYLTENNINLVPQSGSGLLAGASFTATKLGNPFFETVQYRGAFGATNWMDSWTNFDPQNEPYDYGYGVIPTAVSDSKLEEIKIIPNPAQNDFVITGIAGEINCTITNLAGKVVSHGRTSGKIDISHLPSGLYDVTISDSTNLIKHVKVVVSK
jgi:hypothetical protein